MKHLLEEQQTGLGGQIPKDVISISNARSNFKSRNDSYISV